MHDENNKKLNKMSKMTHPCEKYNIYCKRILPVDSTEECVFLCRKCTEICSAGIKLKEETKKFEFFVKFSSGWVTM